MPLRLEIQRRLTARSERVKSADLHPTEPWMVLSLYTGTVVVWNYETQAIVKSFELCNLPVRVAKFVARKHWIIAGADDMQIRVFNYNTLDRIYMFEAHCDYIRCVAVHPTQPFILTSSDDMLIKLWDWNRKWMCCQVFEGHTHYVMQIVFNPKDNNQFASASLDRTIKVWQLGSKTPNFTLEGHEKGVNCIDYYNGGDKPYLISGADDQLVKIWDYQNKTCVQTLEGHVQNVTCVCFHPKLPVILTGSEDGTVRVWHSNTYRLENTLHYGMERVWCISGQPGSNNVALGYDEGSIIIKLGQEEPAMSMDSGGKIMLARHSEVQQANLKVLGETEIQDGEKIPLGVKDMGSCEIYPQTIQHSPNGRFVVVCGDGEYIIYTAMVLRNKSFGSAQEFVWAHDSSQYATREGNSVVKIFKNFKEKKTFKPDSGADGIFGGFLLGVNSNTDLAFYDWESSHLIHRVEILPKHIFWSDSGELLCIATEESFFVLRYLTERVSEAQESKEMLPEDGIEDAFEVLGEVQEVVKTGLWVGDCFIYTNSINRLNYYVGGEIITIAHLDRTMYLLGYIPKNNRLYLGDKELNITSYSLLLSVLEYETAVMRKDFNTADSVLPTIPMEQRTRVAHFLEKQGFRQQALAVSTDPEHKFELALQLGELRTAHELALEATSEHKWKQLAEVATTKSQFSLAQECLHQAQDYGGLLLLATASSTTEMVEKLAEGAEKDGKTNVAFLAYFMQGRTDKCLELLIKTNRLPEAAFLARTYMPSHVSRVVKLWKENLSEVNQKAADALADPSQYSNLFPGLQQALLAEQYLKETHGGVRRAAEYPLVTPNEHRDVLEESKGLIPQREITEPEEGLKSMSKNPVANLEAAVMENSFSIHVPCADPVLVTERTTGLTTEKHPEPNQAQSPCHVLEDAEGENFMKSETLVFAEERLIQEPYTEFSAKESDTKQSCPMEDVRLTDEVTVQEKASAAEAQPASGTENIMVAEEEATPAAEDLKALEEISSPDQLEKGIISSEVPPMVAIATDETPAVKEPAAVEELISLEPTESTQLDVPSAAVQAFSDMSFDPSLNSDEDASTVLKPVPVWELEQEQEEETPESLAETEDGSEVNYLPQAEAEGSDDPAEQEAGSEGSEEPAEDLEEAMNTEDLDDLDLNCFDLEDIDTSDVNLEETLLGE
ncbi:coatomer subunit beta'-like [Girardinichthys multiradiatus]|uniref:coatomer subunit beta'-like n=1 Tax=Girardinichthys multiradiatus TaxID=208333 RepID=UPI001FAB4A09|nr:coatomer subunit beta'-like [Girardinichthys multiradiatus]